ncbi:MAG TPA: sigma-E factor negative regulatory protein [Noviherbaspirillum sp.]|nr:sigma-E factor negative regulatory protein [Noviherbaspirillum sp.]
MKTKEMAREDISALADGELAGHHVEMAFAALRQKEGRADWDVYHQIGDVLRSDDMAVTLSPGFAERMAARLDAEPAIVAPAMAQPVMPVSKDVSRSHQVKRWAMPGMAAAAAMAAVAFIATPQLMVAMNGANTEASSLALSAERVIPSHAEQSAVVAASIPEGVVLRDPRIDEYLLAHQRFSPSVYSTAQYARSATFAADSDK